MLDDRRRDKRIDFISSSDNYQDSNSSNERYQRGAKQEVLLYDDDSYGDDDSYENLGDIEDLTRLTDDYDQKQKSTKSSQPSSQKGLKDKILGDHIERYEQIRRVHMTFRLNGYDSPEGEKALANAEAMIKKVYKEILVTQE